MCFLNLTVAIVGCPPLVSYFTIWHNFVRLADYVVAIFTVAWLFLSFLYISEIVLLIYLSNAPFFLLWPLLSLASAFA